MLKAAPSPICQTLVASLQANVINLTESEMKTKNNDNKRYVRDGIFVGIGIILGKIIFEYSLPMVFN